MSLCYINEIGQISQIKYSEKKKFKCMNRISVISANRTYELTQKSWLMSSDNLERTTHSQLSHTKS